MKKEFELSAKINTADFDRSIQEMVKKLKDVSQPVGALQQQMAGRMQQQGMGGMSAPSMEAYQKATQSARREMDQMISEQAKGQEKLGKFIAQRTESIKKLVQEQQKLVQGSKEELAIREKIARSESEQQNLKSAYRQRDSMLSQSLDVRQQMQDQSTGAIRDRNPAGWGRAGRFAGQGMYGAAGREAFGAIGGFGGIGGIAGSMFGALGAAGATAEKVTGYGQRLQGAMGSAIEGSAGQNLRDVYSGRSPFENTFAEERTAAAGLAKQKEERNRITDRMKGIGGVGAGAVGGAAVGAAIGSVVPVIGTAIGAVIGGGLGAAGSYFNSNDRTRQSINPFGQKEYNKLLANEQQADFRKTYEDIKNQDPGKKLAMEDFEANKERNVRIQRTLGLSNNQFYKGGGFLSDVQQGGFMGEQGINMANQIVGAGGSARMGQNAKFGLQMERAGLTNASGILGTMSGSIQNPEANKRATISIMSEAFKIGLDNTAFAEENRRFAQAAANVIGRTGVTSEDDQNKLAAVLSQFTGQRTNSGVQEAQTAYEKFQERGSQTSGRRGALRFAELMKDPVLSKLSTSDATELMSMRPEEMNSSNPAMASFAKSANTTVEDLVERMQGPSGVNQAGRFLFPGQREKVTSTAEKLNTYMKKNNLSYTEFGDMSRKGELPEAEQAQFGDIIKELQKSEAGGLTAKGGIAAAGEFLHGVDKAGGGGKSRAQEELEKGPGRLEDAFTKKAAEGADEARKNFNLMTDSLWKVVEGANALTKATAPLAATLHNAAQQNVNQLPKGNAFNTDIANAASGAQTQQQSNKPKK